MSQACFLLNVDSSTLQVYDSCRVSGYRWFVVTTYQYWVFGTFSLGTLEIAYLYLCKC